MTAFQSFLVSPASKVEDLQEEDPEGPLKEAYNSHIILRLKFEVMLAVVPSSTSLHA